MFNSFNLNSSKLKAISQNKTSHMSGIWMDFNKVVRNYISIKKILIYYIFLFHQDHLNFFMALGLVGPP